MTPAMLVNFLVLVMAIVAITLASIAYVNRNPTCSCSPAVMIGASASADGVSGLVTKPLLGDESKYLAGSGLWTGLPAGSSAMVGATATTDGVSGLVTKPLLGDQAKYLAGDGTWKVRELGFIGMADVAAPGGVFPVPHGTSTKIPMNTLYETGYAPHPSFDSNTTTSSFDILVDGRYRVDAQIRMDPTVDGLGVPPNNSYELSIYLGQDRYTLSATQFTETPSFLSGAVLSGSVILNLTAGTSVTCEMLQSNGGGLALNANGSVIGGLPPFPVAYYSYMQIERLQ